MSMFIQNVVSKEYVDAHSGASIDAVSAATVASAATIDLTGLDGEYQIDVTGTTTITAITLGDGIEHVLRFTGALTLTQGASLLLPGGVSIATVANDWGIFRGAAGVVTVLNYQTSANYSKQTFDNVFMNPGANIGFPPGSINYFTIGYNPDSIVGNYLRINYTNNVGIRDRVTGRAATFNTTLLSGNTKEFFFPNHNGTFLTHDDDLGTPTAGNLVNCTGYPGIPTVGGANFWQKSDGTDLVNSLASDDGTNTTILGQGGLVAIGDANLVGNFVLLKVDDGTKTITIASPVGGIHINGFTLFLDNLTSDGFVRTNSGIGELSIDTTVYSTFDGAFTSLSAVPTTIGGYGITDFNSLGDARWQPLDASTTARLNLAIL